MKSTTLIYSSSKTKQLAVYFLALLTLTGLPTAATAQATTTATQATAIVEFLEGDNVEAIIDIESIFVGEQGNGLTIAFSEAALGFASPSSNVIGNAELGFVVQLNADLPSIPYDEIAQAIGSLAEVTVALRDPLVGLETYDPLLQDPPATAVLSGGVDATVPEPSAVVLTSLLGALCWTRRPRRP